MRLLIAEDERDLNNVLVKRLKRAGYSVDTVYDGISAMNNINSVKYDGIILDIMMPGKDGFEVLRNMRNSGLETPVLILTARDGISDRVMGLDLGADDYLVKPFAFDEFLARIRAMTRKRSGSRKNVYTVEDLTLDSATRTVVRSGENIELSAKEFAVLEYMIMNAGIVLSRDKIQNSMCNIDYDGGSNLVDVYIRYLRKKIDDGYERKLIKTVRGAGYVIR